MAVNDYIYRLKAEPGDTAPHDELGNSANLGTGMTTSLVDRGSGDVAWRFSLGAGSIAIPGPSVEMGVVGKGATMALTVKIINYGTTSYRHIVNINTDPLPAAYASASTVDGLSFARHGTATVRAVADAASYTGNITLSTEERTFVLRLATNKSGNYEFVEMWATDPANPSTAAYVGNAGIIIGTANNGIWDTLSIDCSSGIVVEIKDLVVWPNEKTDSECAALAVNLRAQLDTAADTTSPTFTGTPTTNSVTTTGFTFDWSTCVASDNVGVTGYQTSLNNSTWTSRGNVTSFAFTGLSPATAYTPYVRAHDAAGLYSTSLTANVTTNAEVADTTPPTHTGELVESNVTYSGFTITCPVASDNVGVTGYEYSTDNSVWNDMGTSRVQVFTGLASATAYPVYMRAYDAAGLRSTPALTKTVTTLVAPDTQFVSKPLVDNANMPYRDISGWTMFVHDVATGALISTHTGKTTDAFAVLTFPDAAVTRGVKYRVIFRLPSGAEGMQILEAI